MADDEKRRMARAIKAIMKEAIKGSPNPDKIYRIAFKGMTGDELDTDEN